ncbi:solute carrier family 23 protein [Arcanobacterium ihumii]|uniref:solute carrier family 23 protein n=1 Tax=Arcanobacterium ihumii TaxID=2138162 RepID=UPI001F2FE970|nr:solute carrier family 23 protein [Arcanobacterium ihumii]
MIKTNTTKAPNRIVDPINAVPAAPKLTLLSIQHVLAFYAGAVIVPLLIASSLKLDAQTTIHLINADLFTCGLATLIQSAGLGPKIGVRLPIIQGVTTTSVAPIIAIGLAATGGEGGKEGLPLIYGAVIIAGLFTFFVAPYFAKLLRFFPSVVTGTVLLVMGTSLLAVSTNDFVNYADGVPAVRDLAYGFGTLAVIVLVQRFFKGFLGTIAVLIGLVGGTTIAYVLGDINQAKVDAIGTADVIGITTPFYFGIPTFSFTAILSMIVVMLITMVETTGDVFATGEIVGKRINAKDVTAAIRADGLSTTLGGVLNSFPYTCFAQNVGLVRITRIRSRWVATGSGVLMVIIGLIPKAGAIVNSIPSPVLGGASLALFANVAWVGMQTISKANMRDNRNAVIVTTSLGLAMLVTFRPTISQVFPDWAQVFFSSGMSIGAITAIFLNLLFFHVGNRSETKAAVALDGDRTVSLDQVNSMDKETFVETFRSLFNNELWPLTQAWESRPFTDVHELRAAIQTSVLRANVSAQERLIADYPSMYDLISVDDDEAARISKDTGSLALASATTADLNELRELSERYEEKFGLPYVARLDREDSVARIIHNGVRRLANSTEQEHNVAISEVVEISNDRLDILLRDANPIRREWEANH